MSKKSFLQKFMNHKAAMIGLIVLVVEIVALIVLPFVMQLDPYSIDPAAFNAAPDGTHILGTDEVGRDMFSRIVYGGRVSLLVGFVSTAISVIIGLPLGLIAGYYRGYLGTGILRLADIFMSFPVMILILVFVAVFSPSIVNVTIIIGVVGWTATAKLLYANVLAERKKEYVEAAKSLGVGDLKILFQYILPNSVAPLWMSIAFRISQAIILESSLSFLGAGVQPPMASWGNIIYSAQNLMVLTRRPWMWIPAGICLMVTIISINLIGEGVRDALDPKMSH